MSFLNDIFRYFLLQRLKQVEDFCENPIRAQEQLMHKIVQKAKNTAYGKMHDFENIKDGHSFAEKIPVQDYNGLKPFIDRMMKGEADVLWPGNVNWYAKSSGTTDDRSKFIPVSEDSLQDCHYKAGKDMYAFYYQQLPEANVVDGRTLVLGGSHEIHKLNDNCRYGDLSAVLMQNAPFWAEYKRVPSLEIALMGNWEEKIDKLAKATVDQKITNILGVPTWTVVLIRYLFEMTGKNNLADIWPDMQLYVHGGVSFTPYRDLFKDLIVSDKMHYMETYNASEGFFGVQDNFSMPDMLLMLDYGIYYEFIPADEMDRENPKVIQLQDVKEGENYALVISTNGGLWRYAIGDTIRFTSTNPYRIVVSGRTKHFMNAFGEEVIVDNAEKALAEACRKNNCVVSDFTAAPVYFSGNGNGAHEWLIEFEKEPVNLNQFTFHLDEKLREINSDYDAKRQKDIALRMPIVKNMPKGTFYEWMKKRGKLGGQNKVPRLSNHRKFVEDILTFSSTGNATTEISL